MSFDDIPVDIGVVAGIVNGESRGDVKHSDFK